MSGRKGLRSNPKASARDVRSINERLTRFVMRRKIVPATISVKFLKGSASVEFSHLMGRRGCCPLSVSFTRSRWGEDIIEIPATRLRRALTFARLTLNSVVSNAGSR